MAGNATKYSNLLDADFVRVGLKAVTKHAAIDELVNLLEGHSGVVDLESVRSAVHERESLMSTGVGLGLALPHAKSSGVTETVIAVGISPSGLDFESVDGREAHIVFLLVGPNTARSEHIRILSWISRLMNRTEIRESLVRAESAGDVVAIIKSSDEKTAV